MTFPAIVEQLVIGTAGVDAGGEELIRIEVDGINFWRDVLYASAEFVSLTNGMPGYCSFRVRDREHTRTIRIGARIVVSFKGLNQWQGYVRNVRRGYAFDAENIHETPMRFLIVDGADINILFRTRWVFNQADPGGMSHKIYTYLPDAKPTRDVTAIAELVTNWLDLSGDDIDTETLVTPGGVGDINVDQDVVPFKVGDDWAAAMHRIAQLPAAIYCIDPDRKLVYADVDQRDAPFVLQDRLSSNPKAATYREFELTRDGSDLVTDVAVWGLGTGKKKPVFRRIASDPEGHGLWQLGDLRYDIWQQKTVDRIAASIIHGSPGSHRGHKYDKISIRATTFVPGFRAGQRVGFRNFAWDYVDTIPIRELRMTFPSPKFPRFDLTLSHEIDEPWSFLDLFVEHLERPQDVSYPIVWDRNGVGPCKDGFIQTTVFAWSLRDGDIPDAILPPPPHCTLVLASGSPFTSAVIGFGQAYVYVTWLNPVFDPETFEYSVDYGIIGVLWHESFFDNTDTLPVYRANGDPFKQTAGSRFFVRLVHTGDQLRFRMWPADEDEPTAWHTVTLAPTYSGFGYGGYPIDVNPKFQGNFGPDNSMITGGAPGNAEAIVIGAGPGQGWVWFSDVAPGHSPPVSPIYRINEYDCWFLRFFPAGTLPDGYGTTPGGIEAIDAICEVLNAPHFARDDSSEENIGQIWGSTPDATVLSTQDWAWNLRALPGEDDGRMIDHGFNVIVFPEPPLGATAMRISARVYVWAPQTGIASLGDQPDPSGEGALGWALWSVDYQNGGSIPPGHTVIASGSLSDYNKWSYGAPSIYEDVNLIVPLGTKLGGTITNSYSDLILTHLWTGSTNNPGGRRILQLRISNIHIGYLWIPPDAGIDVASGEVGGPMTGLTDVEIKIKPYFKGTTKIWKNGLALILGTDYVETTPFRGIITLTDTPISSESFVIVYRAATMSGGDMIQHEKKVR